MNTYFITGTDTDCGKTYVTCQLIEYFKKQKKRVLAIKPVASGCIERNGLLHSEDVLNLQKHNCETTHSISGWQFAPPISPHLAAKAANIRLSASDIASFCSKFSNFDPLLIEGAGGLMVPLNEKETWLDFLELTKIPVIVVVAMRLGCINHALLTAEILKHKQRPAAGWIANCIDQDMLALDENIATLTAKMNMPLLGVVGYQGIFKKQSSI